MKLWSSLVRAVCGISAMAVAVPVTAQAPDAAATYPNRAVRIIVPFGAGSGPDVRARQLGDKLSALWGQPVIIDNRAGAGGQIGMQQAANAAPDGYTVVMAGQSAMAIQPHLVKQPFDPLKDFVPVASTGKGAMVLVIGPKVSVGNVKDLIALAQRQPGKLNAASWGNATIPHLALEIFKRAAAVDIAHVPYKDGSLAVKDLMAGEVEMAFDFLQLLGPQIRAGRLKALAVTGRNRLATLPDVPTFTEAGLREMENVGGWQGVAAPAGTPSEIVEKLNAAIISVLALPDVRASYVDVGFEPATASPREFAEFIREENARWGKLIAASGIRAD
jgi:tripartite-type tricarboxylate transporter receptor subunit TctC